MQEPQENRQALLTALEGVVRSCRFSVKVPSTLHALDHLERSNRGWYKHPRSKPRYESIYEIDIHDGPNRNAINGLTSVLERMLVNYIEPTSGRVGNGTFELLGGTWERRYPTIPEYTQMAAEAAARAGPKQITEKIAEWAETGRREAFKIRTILAGVDVQNTVDLTEGVRLVKLPNNSADAANELPVMTGILPGWLLHGKTVLEVEYLTAKPSLYRPEHEEVMSWFEQSPGRQSTTIGWNWWPMLKNAEGLQNAPEEFVLPKATAEGIAKPYAEDLCKSVALACDTAVRMGLMWDHLDICEAFRSVWTGPGGIPSHHYPNIRIREEQTRRIITVHNARCARESVDEHGLIARAIDLWRKAKAEATQEEKLVHLRRAIEALARLDPHERPIGVKVSERVSKILGDTTVEERDIATKIKKAYKQASTAVHPRKGQNLMSSDADVAELDRLCREAIMKTIGLDI